MEEQMWISQLGMYIKNIPLRNKKQINQDFLIELKSYPQYLPPEAIYRQADKPEATGKVRNNQL